MKKKQELTAHQRGQRVRRCKEQLEKLTGIPIIDNLYQNKDVILKEETRPLEDLEKPTGVSKRPPVIERAIIGSIKNLQEILKEKDRELEEQIKIKCELQKKLEEAKICISKQSGTEKDLLGELDKLTKGYREAIDQDIKTISFKNEEIEKLQRDLNKCRESYFREWEDLSSKIKGLEGNVEQRDNTILELKKEINQDSTISQDKLEEQTRLIGYLKQDKEKLVLELEGFKRNYVELDKTKFDIQEQHRVEMKDLNELAHTRLKTIRRLDIELTIAIVIIFVLFIVFLFSRG